MGGSILPNLSNVFPADPNQQSPQQPAQQQQPQNPDQASAGLDAADQFYRQQLQANTPNPPSGGPVKNVLQRFFSGMGNSMMHEAGLPNQYDLQQRALQGIQATAAARGTLAYHQVLAQLNAARTQQAQINMTPITAQRAAALGHPEWADAGLTEQQAMSLAGKEIPAEIKPLNVPQVGGFTREPGGQFTPISGAQLPQVTLSPGTMGGLANAGITPSTNTMTPQMAGQVIGAATKQVGTAQGAAGPYFVNKLTGQSTSMNIGSPYVARAWAFAQARAANTPYQTAIPGTNIPTTVSQATALKLGLPQVNVGQLGQIGGNWAIYNDVNGVINGMKEVADKVNLEDPGVKARMSAALSAESRTEAEKGNLTGALQRLYSGAVYGSMSPEEQTLATLYLQGKAGIIGMRKIMGQAGASDIQRNLDAALFAPGGLAQDRDSLKRGLDMTQGLLGRYAPGIVQAGLNAPNTPTALTKGTPLTMDEARTYLQKSGGDKVKARAAAKADGRVF